MTWKQRNREKRFYYVVKTVWNEQAEEYDMKSFEELTLGEAKRIFNRTKVSADLVQVDIYKEDEDGWCEKIAMKVATDDPEGVFETWDRSEL